MPMTDPLSQGEEEFVRRAEEVARELRPILKKMGRPVSRGVIGTARAGQARLKPMDAEQIAENAYAVIGASDPDFYQLRDRRDLMRRLARGDADIHGRRLFTDAATADARYVIRLINQRLRHEDFTQRQGAMLRASLRRVYAALEDGKL